MNNIMEIFNRITLKNVRRRTLLIYLFMLNVILSIAILVFSNAIISSSKATGTIDYNTVRLFYTFAILVLFILSYVLTPLFLSRSINSMYRDNIIDNLHSARVKNSDIVLAVYLRGLTYLVIIITSALPILSMSFLYGGVGAFSIAKILIAILCYTILFSAISMYISSTIYDLNISMVVSYVVGFILLVVTLVFLNYMISEFYYIFFYVFFALFCTIILLLNTTNASMINM